MPITSASPTADLSPSPLRPDVRVDESELARHDDSPPGRRHLAVTVVEAGGTSGQGTCRSERVQRASWGLPPCSPARLPGRLDHRRRGRSTSGSADWPQDWAGSRSHISAASGRSAMFEVSPTRKEVLAVSIGDAQTESTRSAATWSAPTLSSRKRGRAVVVPRRHRDPRRRRSIRVGAAPACRPPRPRVRARPGRLGGGRCRRRSPVRHGGRRCDADEGRTPARKRSSGPPFVATSPTPPTCVACTCSSFPGTCSSSGCRRRSVSSDVDRQRRGGRLARRPAPRRDATSLRGALPPLNDVVAELDAGPALDGIDVVPMALGVEARCLGGARGRLRGLPPPTRASPSANDAAAPSNAKASAAGSPSVSASSSAWAWCSAAAARSPTLAGEEAEARLGERRAGRHPDLAVPGAGLEVRPSWPVRDPLIAERRAPLGC